MLPRVKIFFENGALRGSVPMPDGVGGFVCAQDQEPGSMVYGKAYILRSLKDLEEISEWNEGSYGSLYKIVKDFYAEAGADVECWVMIVPATETYASIAGEHAKNLINAAQGRLRWIAVSKFMNLSAFMNEGDPPGGLHSSVPLAMAALQQTCEWATEQKMAPLFGIVDGLTFVDAAELEPVNTESLNRVGVMIGTAYEEAVTNPLDFKVNASIGTLMGRIAVSPVQRNIARVKDGAVAHAITYVGFKPTEEADVETLHDKGYITFRTYPDRGGYYFTDDPLAAPVSDDYSQITRRRTVDKAYRIAYATLINELLDEVPINPDGTLQEGFVKSWQAMVEGDIARQMTANGELSGDVANGDKGVVCYIDPNQNVVSTSKIVVQVRIRPFGYARFIDVHLGFTAVAG